MNMNIRISKAYKTIIIFSLMFFIINLVSISLPTFIKEVLNGQLSDSISSLLSYLGSFLLILFYILPLILGFAGGFTFQVKKELWIIIVAVFIIHLPTLIKSIIFGIEDFLLNLFFIFVQIIVALFIGFLILSFRKISKN